MCITGFVGFWRWTYLIFPTIIKHTVPFKLNRWKYVTTKGRISDTQTEHWYWEIASINAYNWLHSSIYTVYILSASGSSEQLYPLFLESVEVPSGLDALGLPNGLVGWLIELGAFGLKHPSLRVHWAPAVICSVPQLMQ